MHRDKRFGAALTVLLMTLMLCTVATAGVIDYYYHRYFASAADKCFYHKLDNASTGGTWTKCTDYGAATLETVAADTQFDVVRMSSKRCRYTFDGTGTDPGLGLYMPGAATITSDKGTLITIAGDSWTAGNNGTFEVTDSGVDFFETYNALCYTEGNKVVGATGSITYRRMYDSLGGATSNFDITEAVTNYCTYTWDGTGTNPGINTSAVKVGDELDIQGENFNADNKTQADVTAVGVNYFTIYNTACVAEANKTIGSGYIHNFGR